MRSHYCGELNAQHLGQQVTIAGWINRRRDLGGLIFLELRDRRGLVQVVVEPDNGDAFEVAQTLRSEYVVTINGTVRARPPEQRSRRMASGAVEILANGIELLSSAQTPPFAIDGSVDAEQINEDLRLRHRYLDLRRPEAARPLLLRHQLSKAIWDYLDAQGFIQVETPLLTRSTPEGARDFVVPARQQAGAFYALPQSPQLFKQMLMIAGFDRYFQIARCFRDEDLRADRQPDFTQLDLEMSFVDQEDILTLNEGLMQHLIKQVEGREITTPFPRLSYREALDRYGSDKPDRRFGLELTDLSEIWQDSDFRTFRSALEGGGCVKAIVVTAPQASKLSRKILGDLDTTARAHGAPGLAWLRQAGGRFSGPIAKFLGENESRALAGHAPAAGDLLLLVAGPWQDSCQALGAVRLALAEQLEMTFDPQELDFLWVVDFPLLEFEAERGGFTYMHHPFTRPRDEDLPLLEHQPQAVRAWAYDLVLNGHEIGGGSLRIHRLELQEQLFELLGFSHEEAHQRFGFFLQALRYGAPPHGGIAWGLDRLIMLLSGASSLRNVIAFPKNQRGADPLTGAPTPLEPEQLRELRLMQAVEETR